MSALPFRVVVTCSTMPTRYDVLQKCVESLLKQTIKLDAIYITLPFKSRRLNIEYPLLPEYIRDNCSIVHLKEDYGPVTKIVGGILAEKDPNTVIISVDDDTIVDPDFVEVLLKYHKTHPKACICGTGALIRIGFCPYWTIISSLRPFDKMKGFTGYNLKKHNNRCDLVFGVGGVLYTREMFPSNEALYKEFLHYAMENDALFHNDDVLISAYLSHVDVDRLVFTDIPSITLSDGSNALSSDFMASARRTDESIKYVRKLGLYKSLEPMSIGETSVCRGVLVFLLIVFLVMIVVLAYRSVLIKPTHNYLQKDYIFM